MNPDRQAMIDGPRSPRRRAPVSAARVDSKNRISKPSRPRASKALHSAATYLTEEEQSRKFVADEDKFVLKQSKRKANIRMREGRAKPIDRLAFNLRYIDPERDLFDDDDGDVYIMVNSPLEIINGLPLAELKELESDITSYHVLETETENRRYWEALRTLCIDLQSKTEATMRDGRVVNSVMGDIDRILSPKTYDQLETLEKQIKAKLRSDDDIDTDYWEQLLRHLMVWKSKAILDRIHGEIIAKRQEMLKARQPIPPSSAFPSTTVQRDGAETASNSTTLHHASEIVSHDKSPLKDPEVGTDSTVPTLNSTSGVASNTTEGVKNLEAVTALKAAALDYTSEIAPQGTTAFQNREAAMSSTVPALNNTSEDASNVTNALYNREAARGISENEEVFAAEEQVIATSRPKWADKYRARKPRYFNRVQMGYEWNKYNQTHYDHDNPPPKMVHGYKFNIFYPDLIEKTKAPTFKIFREHGRRRGESFAAAGEEDTCLIRFIAGPPYEDIAFRIVDREWDFSSKRERGFKSSFEKGILQLHFQFKKIFYRK
ncbi:hypothetical protein E4U28_000706 [Claviceps purpurea]|nr:hypothetical protein E4U28_000706 [Claviceps purpurea]